MPHAGQRSPQAILHCRMLTAMLSCAAFSLKQALANASRVATIAVATAAVRTLMLPVVIYQMKNTARMSVSLPFFGCLLAVDIQSTAAGSMPRMAVPPCRQPDQKWRCSRSG